MIPWDQIVDRFEAARPAMGQFSLLVAVTALAASAFLGHLEERRSDARRAGRKLNVRPLRVQISVFDPARGPDSEPIIRAEVDQLAAAHLCYDLNEGYLRSRETHLS